MRSLDERKPNKPSIARSLMCKALVFVLCATGALSCPMNAQAAGSAKAKSMRLEQTEGDVGVTNITKGDLTYTAGMRLGSGDDVDTDTASYAWISLDDSKAIKVDEVSEVEVRQKGKNLEALLVSGNLYFNVTVPLKSDESMNIRTSTMATGIRGTCGWVSIVDGCNTRVHLLEGVLHCKVINPVDGQIKTVTIHAGEWADFTVYGVEVFDKNPELISTSDGGQVPVTTPVGTDTASGEKTDTSAATAEPAGNAPGTDNNEDGGSADEAGGDTGAVSAEESETAGTSADTSSSEDGAAGTGEALQESEAGGSTYNERPEIPVSPDGESCDISTSRFTEDDIPGFVLVELVGDDPLIEKIYDQSGIDLRNLTQEEAEEKLAEKEAETAERMQAIREAEAAQESNISKDPVWEHDTQTAEIPAEPEPVSEEGSTLGDLVIPAVTPVQNKPVPQKASTPKSTDPTTEPATPAETTTKTAADQTTQPAQNADNSAPASGTSGSGDPSTPSSSNNNNSSSVMTLTMPQTATDVQGYLNQSGISQVILQPGSGNNTLAVDIDFTVPSGKTLTAQGGVPVDVQSGKTASINGTADLGSSLSNSGTINVNSSHTLKVAGQFTNSGAFNNTSTGKSEFTGGVTNTGSFTTSGILNLTGMTVSGGTFTVSGGTVTAASSIQASGGAVNVSGGTLTSSSSGTVLTVSGAAFTMNGGTITSDTSGLTVVLSSTANVQLNSGNIQNSGDGGALSASLNGQKFQDIMGTNMLLTSKTDNLLGNGMIDAATTGTSLGLISVWDGTLGDHGEFCGALYDGSTMMALTLSSSTSASGYTIDTIRTPCYVKFNTPVPLEITPDTGWEITSVGFYNGTAANASSWNVTYNLATSTSFMMPTGYTSSDSVDIRVTASRVDYTLAKAAVPAVGGVIALSVGNNDDPNTAQYQDTVNVNVEAAAGYELSSLTYTPAGGTATAITHTNGIGSFSMPAANVTVNAAFALKTYTLSATTTTSTAHGLVQVNPNIARMGDEIIVTTTPDPGYKLTALTWHASTDTTPQDILTTKKFNMPADAVIIEATFEPLEYNVTLNLNAGTDTTAQIAAGKNVTRYTYGVGAALPVTADVTRDEYIFGGWYTSANPAATDGSITAISNTDMGDKVFYAKWVRRTYGISVANGITNGTVTVNGNRTSAASGESISITTTPTNGYKLKSLVYRHGSSLTAIDLTSKTFVMPSYAITIDAEFEKETYALTLANSGTFTGGSITVTPTSAQMGDQITVTAIPSGGYKLKSMSYTVGTDTTPYEITVSGNVGTFNMPVGAVTLSAEFELETYTPSISYNDQNGTVTLNPSNATLGQTVNINVTCPEGKTVSAVTVKEAGTNTDIQVTEVIKDVKYSFTQPACPVTVDIAFTNASYAVTLNKNDSIEAPATITGDFSSYTYGTGATLPTAVTRTSTVNTAVLYEFAGWYESQNPGENDTPVLGIPTTATGAKTYYAKWTVKYAPDTSTGIPAGTTASLNPANALYGQTVEINISTLPIGKVVDVVSVKEVGTNNPVTVTTVTPNVKYTFVQPARPVTVSITLKDATYTITLNRNDSTEAPATITGAISSYTYGTGATLPATVTRTSTINTAVLYEFAGWYESQNPASTDTPVTVIPTDATGNKTYYAKWNIRYAPDTSSGIPAGTSASLDPANAAYGQTVEINISALPTGKVVDVVSVKEVGTNNPVTVTTVTPNVKYTFVQPACPVTVTITLKNATYTVTLNTQGGTINANNVTGYTYGTAVTLPTNVTKSGSVFGGWYTTGNPSQSDVPVTTIPANATGPQVFYAKWIQNTVKHRVILSGNGNYAHGTVDKYNTGTYFDPGEDIYLDVRPEIGYKVKDLYYIESTTSAHVMIINDSFVMPDSDVTVYAEFEIETYTVTYDLNADGDASAQMPAGAIKAYTYGTGFNLPAGVTRTGYTFDGWYTQASGGLKTTRIKTTDTGNKRFYAHWSQAPVSYNVSVASVSNGTVTADKTSAVCGDTVTLTIIPATNYSMSEITAQTTAGLPLTVTFESYDLATNTYTEVFVMPSDNVTVSAAFYEDNPAVTYYDAMVSSYIDFGRVETDKPHYEAGETVVITLIPDSYYELSGAPTVLEDTSGNVIPVTDISSGTDIKYSFQMPSDDVRISATFSFVPQPSSISSSYSTAGGTVSVLDDNNNVISSSVYGATVYVKIKPNSGYSFAGKSSLTVSAMSNTPFGPMTSVLDPSHISGSDTPDADGFYIYSFTMANGDVTLGVVFDSNSAVQSTISIDNTTQHGTIVPDKTNASAGEIIALTVTPDPGYTLSNIIIKDVANNPIDVSDQYTFGMPEGNVTVKGVFVPVYEITPSYDTQRFNGIGFFDPATGMSLEDQNGITAKAGDTVLARAEIKNNTVVFDGISITDAGGNAVTAQFIERTEKTLYSMYGPSETHVYYTYSFTMPASAVTVSANATARRINISSVKVYYRNSITNAMSEDNDGTYGSAQLDRTSGEPGDTLTLSVSANTGYCCYAWGVYESSDQTNFIQSATTSDVIGVDLDTRYSYDQTLFVIFTETDPTPHTVTVSPDDMFYLRADKQTAATGQPVYVTVDSPDGHYCKNLLLVDEYDDIIATVPAGNIENGIVNFEMPPLDIEIKADWGDYHEITKDYNTRAGSVSINGNSTADTVYAKNGDGVSVEITPNSGYSVVSATYTYLVETVHQGGKGSYTSMDPVSRTIALNNGVGSFTMPDADVEVCVEFESTSSAVYDIEIDANSISNGTVTSNVTGDVSQAGRYITITAVPDTGYKLLSLVVSDSSGTPMQTVSSASTTGNTFSFYMPDENVSVVAVFERYYTIGYGGDSDDIYFTEQPTFGIIGQPVTITVNDYSTIHNGDYYGLDSIEYEYVENGNTVTHTLVKNSDGNYTFIMPEANVTVYAYKTASTYYEVSVSVEGGQGTWTAPSTKVEGSGSLEYTITPAEGYILQKVEYGARKYSFNPLTYETTEYAPIQYTATPSRNSNGTYTFTYYMYSSYYNYGGISGEQRRPKIWLYFVKESYDVNVSGSISGGTVTPSSDSAEMGDTVTLTVAPETDHSLKNISVTTTAGTNVALTYSNGTYSFTMPASAVTVSAEFIEDSNIGTASGTSSDGWFSDKDFVRITSDTTLDTLLTVPTGKTLTIASGVTINAVAGVTIESGAILNNYGTFNNSGTMTNNGTFNNYSGNTLNNYGTIINNGTLVNGDGASNDGRLNNFDGAVIENNGTIINNEGSVVNNDGEIEGNDIIGSGEVNDDSETADQSADDADIPENADDNTATGDDKKDTIEATTGDDEGESQTDDSDSNYPLNTESRDASAETVEGGSSQKDDDSGSGSDSGDGVSQSGDTQPGGLSDSSGGAQGNDGGDSGSGDTQGDD